jgi:hypothetical protein
MGLRNRRVSRTIRRMPNDQPQSQVGNYCITAIDKLRGVSAVAAGMTFRQAVELRGQLQKRWTDVAFIVEPEPDPERFCVELPVYQIVGVNEDRTRIILMMGMTLSQAEGARDSLLVTGAFLWIWIEREPIAVDRERPK